MTLTDEQNKKVDEFMALFDNTGTDWDGIDDEVMLRILEGEKLREEIQSLRFQEIRGSGYYRFIKLIGVETKFDLEQFIKEDTATDNDWNVPWLVATLQELWSKPIIQKVLKETFGSNK